MLCEDNSAYPIEWENKHTLIANAKHLLKQVPYCLSIVFIKIKEKGTALTVKYLFRTCLLLHLLKTTGELQITVFNSLLSSFCKMQSLKPRSNSSRSSYLLKCQRFFPLERMHILARRWCFGEAVCLLTSKVRKFIIGARKLVVIFLPCSASRLRLPVSFALK